MKHFNKRNEHKVLVSYDITMACNNRCPYCIRGHELDQNKMVNPEICDLVVSGIYDILDKDKNRHMEFELLGGDPLFVVDKTVEIIERLQDDRIDIIVTTNLNFDPDGYVIKSIMECSDINRFTVTCSWHESSNEDYIKRNLIQMKDIVEVMLLVSDENINRVYEQYKWIRNNIGNVLMTVEPLNTTDGSLLLSDLDNPLYVEMVMNSIENDVDLRVTIDDVVYDYHDCIKLDLKSISSKYYTICKLAQFRIKWDGKIKADCAYPLKGHIRDGLPDIKEVFCNKHRCICDLDLYKKLIRER